MKNIKSPVKYASHRRTDLLRFHLHEGPLKNRTHRHWKWNGGHQGLEGGEIESCYSMSIHFQLCKMSKFYRPARQCGAFG